MKILILLFAVTLFSCSDEAGMDDCAIKKAKAVEAYRKAKADPDNAEKRAEFGRLKSEWMNCGND